MGLAQARPTMVVLMHKNYIHVFCVLMIIPTIIIEGKTEYIYTCTCTEVYAFDVSLLIMIKHNANSVAVLICRQFTCVNVLGSKWISRQKWSPESPICIDSSLTSPWPHLTTIGVEVGGLILG